MVDSLNSGDASLASDVCFRLKLSSGDAVMAVAE